MPLTHFVIENAKRAEKQFKSLTAAAFISSCSPTAASSGA